ncbi:patatin-like phospholipase family protein [Gemmata sp.]|uniref:patatin-like phospholipase family protein n=1 Tax=Gemmata sp. TaxID=1914242 RepID=UPI003F6F481D
MSDEIVALLKVHAFFRGLGDEAVRDVLAVGRAAEYATGGSVHEPGEPVASVRFVLRGRLKAVRVDAHGRETLFRTFDRGEQLGLMIGVLNEQVPLRVYALEPTTVLEVAHEDAMDLTARHADLRRLWLRTYAGALRKHFFGVAGARGPTMLALVHETPATRPLARKLVERLSGLGEALGVFSDAPGWQPAAGVGVCSLTADGGAADADAVRRQVAEWHGATRIVYDVGADLARERMDQLLRLADRIVYLVPAAAGAVAVDRLRALDVAARGLREKVCVAWLLEPGRTVAPPAPGLSELAGWDVKVAEAAPAYPSGRVLGSGFERLVHELRGVRIGVALGGGAARGMSHLGVLKALEDSGIVVDAIAGTSAGALTGAVYASGLDSAYSTDRFAADLSPSWVFRRFPKGSYWHLLYQYRRGHFDPMLRKYLRDWTLEQLAVPCLPVTVDLVSGRSVVRDRGDAVHAVLESINLPVLSAPIVRNGEALIDGGLVNNVPADVLVARGCNFVIAVSVTAKMERRFCDITPGGPVQRRGPSTLQTILRSLLVQNHSLNGIGVQPADVVIEPDVTGFDLSEFMRAKELAAVGERAALEQIPRVKQLLARLDPHLFPLAPPGGV